MTDEPSDHRTPGRPERAARCDLPGLLRALDDVEPPPLWDDILASAFEPAVEPLAGHHGRPSRRDRRSFSLLVAAAVVVLAVAGAVLALGRDRSTEATLATLGNKTANGTEGAGPPSPSGPGSQASEPGTSRGAASVDPKDPGSDGGEQAGGGSGDRGGAPSGGDDRRADPSADAPPTSPRGDERGTIRPGDPAEPTTTTSSPTSVPTTPTSPTTFIEPPQIWGRIWAPVELHSATHHIRVADLGVPQQPLLDLAETGVVRFSWCNSFTVLAQLVDQRLVTDPDSWSPPPTTTCGDDIAIGEDIVRTLVASDPEVFWLAEADEITLSAGPYSATFTAQT